MQITFEGADGTKSTVTIDDGTGEISQFLVTYEFSDGSKKTEEVDADLGLAMVEMEEDTRKRNRAETRRHEQMSRFDYEGGIFTSKMDVQNEINERFTMGQLRRGMKTLQPQQRDLIQKVFFEQCSLVSIAAEDGITEAGVRNRLKKIYKRLKKFID